MSEERIYNCKHFAFNSCPNRRNESLSAVENMIGEGFEVITGHEVFEKAQEICAECKSFKSKKTDKP